MSNFMKKAVKKTTRISKQASAKAPMKAKFNLQIGMLFLLVGLLLSTPLWLSFLHKDQPQPLVTPSVAAASNPNTTPTGPSVFSGNPSHLSVPSVGISVDVTPGYYSKATSSWTVSNTKANFAVITAEPNNQSGNTFIYGHALKNIFASLPNVKNGDQAIVTTANGHTFTYTLTKHYDADPTDTSLFYYQGPPILTLQTCTGTWYQHRGLYTFSLVEAH